MIKIQDIFPVTEIFLCRKFIFIKSYIQCSEDIFARQELSTLEPILQFSYIEYRRVYKRSRFLVLL